MTLYIVVSEIGLHGLSIFDTIEKAEEEVELLRLDFYDNRNLERSEYPDWIIDTITLNESNFVAESEN